METPVPKARYDGRRSHKLRDLALEQRSPHTGVVSPQVVAYPRTMSHERRG